jgi:hypothetical protein
MAPADIILKGTNWCFRKCFASGFKAEILSDWANPDEKVETKIMKRRNNFIVGIY